MHSIRASMQSVTAKRQSSEQQQSSAMAVANKSVNLVNLSSTGGGLHTQQKSVSSTESFVENMSSTSSSSSTATANKASITLASLHASRNMLAKENFLKMNSYDALCGADGRELLFDNNFVAAAQSLKTAMTTSSTTSSSCKNSFQQTMTSNSTMQDAVFIGGDGESGGSGGDGGDESDNLPPALPIKTRQRSIRRDRNGLQLENAEEIDNFPK